MTVDEAIEWIESNQPTPASEVLVNFVKSCREAVDNDYPSPEAFGYLSALRETYVKQIKDLERKLVSR